MLHLSIRRIEVFVTVVDAGGFAAAAAQLGISQPSVSVHIRALEESLGEVLLERRRGHAARLTPAGAILLDKARALLDQAKEVVAYVSAGNALRQKRIVIASQRRLSNAALPSLMASFAHKNPDAELVVRSGSMEEVVAMLQTGAAHVGYFLCNDPPPGLASTVIAHEPFIFVSGVQHPLAKRKRIAPAELKAYRFIRGAHGSNLAAQVDGLLASIGLVDIDVASRSTDEGIIQELLISGVGIHFTLAKSVRAGILQGLLKRLPVATPTLSVAVHQALSTKLRPTALARSFFRHAEAHWPG